MQLFWSSQLVKIIFCFSIVFDGVQIFFCNLASSSSKAVIILITHKKEQCHFMNDFNPLYSSVGIWCKTHLILQTIWPHLRLVWKGKKRTFTKNGRFFKPQNNTKRSDLHDHKTDVSYISNQQKLYEVGYNKSKGNYILQNILSLFSHKLYFYRLAFYYWTII